MRYLESCEDNGRCVDFVDVNVKFLGHKAVQEFGVGFAKAKQANRRVADPIGGFTYRLTSLRSASPTASPFVN